MQKLPLQALMKKNPLGVTSLYLRCTTGRVCPGHVSGAWRKGVAILWTELSIEQSPPVRDVRSLKQSEVVIRASVCTKGKANHSRLPEWRNDLTFYGLRTAQCCPTPLRTWETRTVATSEATRTRA